MPGALPVGFVGLLGFFGLGMDEALDEKGHDASFFFWNWSAKLVMRE